MRPCLQISVLPTSVLIESNVFEFILACSGNYETTLTNDVRIDGWHSDIFLGRDFSRQAKTRGQVKPQSDKTSVISWNVSGWVKTWVTRMETSQLDQTPGVADACVL